MKQKLRATIGAIAVVLLTVPTMADQTVQLHAVMRQKLIHSQAILGAVVTSDWATLDRESRALFKATQDPAWIMMTAPEPLAKSRTPLYSRPRSRRIYR